MKARTLPACLAVLIALAAFLAHWIEVLLATRWVPVRDADRTERSNGYLENEFQFQEIESYVGR